jgi:hypothetical protein
MYLQGKTAKQISKKQKIHENYVYTKIGKEIITINTMLNKDLGLKCADIVSNPEPYADAIFRLTGQNITPKLSKLVRRGVRKTSGQVVKPKTTKITFTPEQFINCLQEKYQDGAKIMFNYLKSTNGIK